MKTDYDVTKDKAQCKKTDGAKKWTLQNAFKSTPLHHIRISGNEIIDLVPDAWTTRIEKAVNTINDMDDD